jgi:hypothetical protein
MFVLTDSDCPTQRQNGEMVMHINRLVERFLEETDLSPTKFGRLVAHDPRLVLDMRNGREVRARMERRLRLYMAQYRDAQGSRGRTAA